MDLNSSIRPEGHPTICVVINPTRPLVAYQRKSSIDSSKIYTLEEINRLSPRNNIVIKNQSILPGRPQGSNATELVWAPHGTETLHPPQY